MILLVGQYSTGKTVRILWYQTEDNFIFQTFIRYLLEQDFPGIRIGSEPTTDQFIAVMHNNESGSGVIPGNALVVDSTKQFRALSKYAVYNQHFLRI
jgi:hypothetical protein